MIVISTGRNFRCTAGPLAANDFTHRALRAQDLTNHSYDMVELLIIKFVSYQLVTGLLDLSLNIVFVIIQKMPI
jgi:hypothetical protein